MFLVNVCCGGEMYSILIKIRIEFSRDAVLEEERETVPQPRVRTVSAGTTFYLS